MVRSARNRNRLKRDVRGVERCGISVDRGAPILVPRDADDQCCTSCRFDVEIDSVAVFERTQHAAGRRRERSIDEGRIARCIGSRNLRGRKQSIGEVVAQAGETERAHGILCRRGVANDDQMRHAGEREEALYDVAVAEAASIEEERRVIGRGREIGSGKIDFQR